MANFNMNMTTGFSYPFGSSTKIPMLIPEYYDQWTDRMENILTWIDEDLLWCIKSGNFHPSMLTEIGNVGSSADVATQTEKYKSNNKHCTHELHTSLPPVVYNYVRACKTAKEIWYTLKDKYQGSEKTKKSYVKQCLLELGEFKIEGC